VEGLDESVDHSLVFFSLVLDFWRLIRTGWEIGICFYFVFGWGLGGFLIGCGYFLVSMISKVGISGLVNLLA